MALFILTYFLFHLNFFIYGSSWTEFKCLIHANALLNTVIFRLNSAMPKQREFSTCRKLALSFRCVKMTGGVAMTDSYVEM